MSSTFGVFMSYCRFEGTKKALNECLSDVTEILENNHIGLEYEPKSETEVKAFREMVIDMVHWLYDTCILDGEGDLDECELDNICHELKGEEI